MKNNSVSKSSSRRALLIVALIGLVFFLALFFYSTPRSSAKSTQLPKVTQASLSTSQSGFGAPARLIIPSIHVDAAIEHVGLTSNGEMDVPVGHTNVGWYALGSRPGDNGSAVLAGHYGLWKNGKSAVFDGLNKLKPGDKVYTEDDKGVIISFVVRESRSFKPEADATSVFISSDGMSHLNLITCEGVWNKISRKYSKRLVVFADKE